MLELPSRRRFLGQAGRMGATGLIGASWLARLSPVSAGETILPADAVSFSSDIEPLVRLIEETPRESLMEVLGVKVAHGLGYTDLLTALLLAGVRNVQPRPHVGFKFHAVLVVNSAHLASQASSGSDRWLPIFWALDYFKSSQARDVDEGDWTLRRLDDSAVPQGEEARKEFHASMESWDVERADRAIAGYARCGSAHEIFESMFRFGARDLRDIGHKAIYVANSYRTLMNIGWRHAEPVLRSLSYALLAHDGEPNPSTSDLDLDRPWRENSNLIREFRADWLLGKVDPEQTTEMVKVLRVESRDTVMQTALAISRGGASPQVLWDAIFLASAEFVMQKPGIVSLHALTSTNALHFAFQTAADETTRRMLLLQALAFCTHFRNRLAADGNPPSLTFETLTEGESGMSKDGIPVDHIFERMRSEPLASAKNALRYLQSGGDPLALMDQARRWVFEKGTDSHDYKYSSAILEDYFHVSPQFRNAFLAAATHKLHGKDEPDNQLIRRIRSALA